MALGVEELVLRLLCSLKLANNPSLDSRIIVTTRFFSKKLDFPSLYETCQPLELVHLTSSNHRFENNRVDSCTYFYNFQHQECVIKDMHVDCECVGSFQYEAVGSRGLIHLGWLFSTYALATGWRISFFLFMSLVSPYALQGRSCVKIPRYPLDNLKLRSLVLVHIFINHFRFQIRSYVEMHPVLAMFLSPSLDIW